MVTRRSVKPRIFCTIAVCAIAAMAAHAAGEVAEDPGLKVSGEVPEDTFFYGYFCGFGKLKEAPADTALGRMLADPEAGKLPGAMKDLITSLVKWGVEQISTEGAEETGDVDEVAVGLMYYPTYAAVMPGPRGMVVVEAGDKAEELAEQTGRLVAGIGKLVGEAGPAVARDEVGGREIRHCRVGEHARIAWTADKGRFVIAAGAEGIPGREEGAGLPAAMQVVAQMMEGSLKGTKSLAESRTFRRMAERSGYEGALDLSYVNVREIVSSVEKLLPDNAKAAVEASGLKSLAAFGEATRFDPPGMRQKGFVWFPEGREGIFKALPARRMTDEELMWVPSDVVGMSAGNVDIGALFDGYLQVVEAASAEAAEEIRSGLAEAKEEVGIDIREEMAGSLGGKVVFYSLGAGLNPFVPRMVLSIEAKNEAKLKECLERLFFYVGAKQALSMAEEPPPLWTMGMENFGSRKVYYMKSSESMWGMNPAVAVEDGRVVAAMAVEDVKEALTRERTKESAILANEDFAQSRKRLPADSLMVTYTDSKRSYETNYKMILMQAKMMSAVTGAEIDLSGLPPAEAVSQHLFGNVSVGVELNDGIGWESYAAVLGIETVPMILMASVTIPLATEGMTTGREQARKAACKNNLKMIGLALHIYSTDHDGHFPQGKTAATVIEELVAGDYLPGEGTFICPAAAGDHEAWERTKKISAATVSYRWVPGLNVISPPDFIIMYDKSLEHHGNGRNALFVDGHVEWMLEEDFQKRLAEQKQRMREERGR